VLALNPVSSYVVTPEFVVATHAQPVDPFGLRSILNPVSLFELPVHASRIELDESAEAPSPLGAAGIVTAGACVVAFAVLLNSEVVLARNADTR
jgi:hypothetical protein